MVISTNKAQSLSAVSDFIKAYLGLSKKIKRYACIFIRFIVLFIVSQSLHCLCIFHFYEPGDKISHYFVNKKYQRII